MSVACLDNSKSNVFSHIVGEESQCVVEQNNNDNLLYFCFFGNWMALNYDRIDQLYCSNNDSYTDSCTNSLYDTFFVRIEYGVIPKKSTLKFQADILSLGVFDYADDESDG